MARGVNKVIIVGNLGADPETRYTGGGTAVTNLRIATSEQWTDKQSGEKQERTEWHSIVMFGRLAEIAGEYLSKGKQVYVEGSLRTEKWTDKDGTERYSTKVYANEMQMLGSVGDGARGGGEQRRANRDAPARGGGDYAGDHGNGPRQNAPAPADGFDDDDIPFS